MCVWYVYSTIEHGHNGRPLQGTNAFGDQVPGLLILGILGVGVCTAPQQLLAEFHMSVVAGAYERRTAEEEGW